jgi:hypothetical protein
MGVLLKTGTRQMRTTLFVYRLALPVCALLFCSLHQAAAQGAATSSAPVNVEQICTPDAMRLCSDVIPDRVKVTACMKAKHAQISKECRVAMAGGGGGGGGGGRRVHHYYHHHSAH